MCLSAPLTSQFAQARQYTNFELRSVERVWLQRVMSGDQCDGRGRVSGVKGIKKVVLVLSGKGGVGKSTVSCQVFLPSFCPLARSAIDQTLSISTSGTSCFARAGQYAVRQFPSPHAQRC